MRYQYIKSCFIAMSLAALCACSDVQENLHEPGVYKGKTDPLLAKSGAEQDKILADRFSAIQTDR